tara:strand:+ start:2790 stop:3581 length:792 start_codon:yes stop_codon:yes gene_type:complete
MSEDEENIKWNNRLEGVVKDIGNDSMAYKIMHLTEAQQSMETYDRLTILGIVTGPLAGIVSAIGATLNMSDFPAIVISEIILGFLSGVIVAILKYGKYDEVSTANKSAAAKYASLEANVRRQLSLYRADRMNSNSYIEWVETKYDEILASAPLIHTNIFDKYSVKAKEEGWNIPNSYSHSIIINEDFENHKTMDMLNKKQIATIEEENITEIKVDIPQKRDTTLKGIKNIKLSRTNIMSKIPEINSCSDQMLNYEMKRMMGFR